MIAPAEGPSSFAGLTGMRLAAWIPLALLGLFIFGGVKKQRRLAWVGCLLVVAFLLASCAGSVGSNSSTTPPPTAQSYSVMVSGASTSPAIQHSMQVTVTVP
jgi:hypothetical protein